MYLIFASWCERFLLWRNFFFILSALFSYFVASLSFSLVCRSKKAPAPFVFFLTFYLFRTEKGPDGSRKGPKLLLFFVVPSASKIKERKKSRQQLFRPRFQSGFVCHQQILSFSDCARKSSIATKKTTYSHTRYNSKKNVFRSFLLCWHQSRRQDERPRLFLLEKSLLGASLRGKKIMVGSRCFFLIRKSQAQARERAF